MNDYDFSTREKRRRFYKSAAWYGKNGIREQALKKGNYECLWCKQEGKVTTIHDDIIEVDHIEEVQDRPDLALELENTRLLCLKHHNLRHNRFGFNKDNKWSSDEWW